MILNEILTILTGQIKDQTRVKTKPAHVSSAERPVVSLSFSLEAAAALQPARAPRQLSRVRECARACCRWNLKKLQRVWSKTNLIQTQRTPTDLGTDLNSPWLNMNTMKMLALPLLITLLHCEFFFFLVLETLLNNLQVLLMTKKEAVIDLNTMTDILMEVFRGKSALGCSTECIGQFIICIFAEMELLYFQSVVCFSEDIPIIFAYIFTRYSVVSDILFHLKFWSLSVKFI